MALVSFLPDNPELSRDRDKNSLYPFSHFNAETRRLSPLYMIAAVGRNMELGKSGQLIWPIRADLKHFKELTTGHPVIMGRATWESLPKRPLPGRTNVVVTSDGAYEAPGALVAPSLPDALAACVGGEVPFVIGGATLYTAALPFATEIYLTEIDAVDPDADCFFPQLPSEDWELAQLGEEHPAAEGMPPYRFCIYVRRESESYEGGYSK